MSGLWAILFLLFTSPDTGPGAKEFIQGETLYLAGDFNGALKAFDQALSRSYHPGPVLYNKANCLFKLNKRGEALFYYQCARKHLPRDKDLINNIGIVKRNLKLDDSPSPSLSQFLRTFTLKEYGICFGFVFSICLAMLALYLFKGRPWTLKLVYVFAGFSLFLMLIMLICWGSADGDLAVTIKICDALSDPNEKAGRILFSLREGEEVKVMDSIEGWHMVEDKKSRRGWIRDGAFLQFSDQV